MIIPLSWLKKYLDLELNLETLSETLTLAGLEVDSIKPTDLGFTDVVTVEVLEAAKHPDADNLQVAQVTDGKDNYQIVCRAPNCRKGIKAALARVGAKLTLPDENTLKIKKSKVRGVESHGMLCAEEELGLALKSTEILELPEDTPTGTCLSDIYGDILLEISLTPNLGHCTSIRGIARELSALLNLSIKTPNYPVQESEQLLTSDQVQISIEADSDCKKFACRYLDDITVKESPKWLVDALERSGIRSVNAVVDATNYCMLELGHPLHAFDYDKIEGSEINVAFVEKQPFTTLDEVSREINDKTLMVCDKTKPIAVAGVMGGLNSSITSSTTRVLLEAAYFTPSTVRRSSKALSLRTDASSRFEKDTDPEAIEEALDMASCIIKDICGGVIAQGIVKEQPLPFSKIEVPLRVSRTNQILGHSFSFGEIEDILKRLKFLFTPSSDDQSFTVTPPSYRNDIKTEIDLIEEVARVYGYNNLESCTPKVTLSTTPHSMLYLTEKSVRAQLLQAGLQEFLTCDLIHPDQAKITCGKNFSDNSLIKVLQPSSIDQSVLRPSLLPGLLQSIKYNADRQIHNISAFEIGHTHIKDNDQYVEKATIGIVLTGLSSHYCWDGSSKEHDFFDLKGIVENSCQKFINTENIDTASSSLEYLHPKRQAALVYDDKEIGFIGEVHPGTLEVFDLSKRVYFAQIDLFSIATLGCDNTKMTPLPQFPGTERDWTATFNEDTPANLIIKTAKGVPSKLLKDIQLINLYKSEKLGYNKKNLTFRFFYRNDKKTLEQASVEKEHARVLSMLDTNLKDYLITS